MTKNPAAFVILILAIALGTAAPRSQSRVAVAQALVGQISAGESVSVIVGVDTTFVPEGALADAVAVADQRTSMARAADDVMARAAAIGVEVGRRFEAIPFFTARVNRATLEALATTAGVKSIEEDRRHRTVLGVSGPLVNAPAAWAAGNTGAGRTVAVLDSGVERLHAFLGGRIIEEACYSGGGPIGTSVCPGGVNSTNQGSAAPCTVDAECSHGTLVAGIVAGANGPGGANGVAPGANLMAVQVVTRLDSAVDCAPDPSPCTTAFTSDIIRGLERVLARAGALNVAAVNMSLAGQAFTSPAACDAANSSTKAAIDNLRSVGVASVIASGNDTFTNAIAEPGCISTAVSVGATTKPCPGGAANGVAGCHASAPAGSLSVPPFSNVATFLNLYAPGVAINSSALGNTFGSADGTSMAAAHVAGAWAILKQAVPAAGVSSVLAAFVGTGTPVTEPFTGLVHPMINVNSARLTLLSAPTNFAVTVSGNNVNMTWTAPVATATGYNLLARLVSGGPIVVSIPLGNVTTFNTDAPNGAFFVSVQATNASGPGPESNVVPVVVPPPPGAPTNLQAAVNGTTVVFTFTPPTSGGPVANYLLLAGGTPGFVAPLASLTFGPTQTTLPVVGAPAGNWFVRVVAQNAGGTSAPTNEVSLTVAGPAPHGAPTLNPAVVAGDTVALSWAPGPGSAPTSYTLFAATSSGGPPFVTAPLVGTSATFGDVPGGIYFVRMVAHNALGTSPPSNEITVHVH